MSKPTDDTFYFDQAEALLTAISGLYTGAEAFETAYVDIGDPAEDCEQLVVSLIQLHTSSRLTAARVDPDHKNTVPILVFRIVLTRCIAEFDFNSTDPPTNEERTDQAAQVGKDGWKLLRFFTTKVGEGLLADIGCGRFSIQPMTFRASGGLATCTVDIQAST